MHIKSKILWPLIIIVLIPSPKKAGATLTYGYADTLWAAFDFSQGRNVWGKEEWGLGDVWPFESQRGPEVSPDYWDFVSERGVIDMGEIPLHEISMAPDTLEVDYWVDPHPVILSGHSYVVVTREGHFVKLFVTRHEVWDGFTLIDWVYQSDGSRRFGTPSSISSSTWGEVKAVIKRKFEAIFNEEY